MSQTTAPRVRPLSPHLSIWRWGPHMLVSILHRATGVVMATVGTVVFIWWLAALASGPDSYADFHYWIVDARPSAGAAGASSGTAAGIAVNWLATLAAFGLSYALFQHLANGVRHLFMDLGANYELRGNKRSSIATIGFAVVATLGLWGYIVMKGA